MGHLQGIPVPPGFSTFQGITAMTDSAIKKTWFFSFRMWPFIPPGALVVPIFHDIETVCMISTAKLGLDLALAVMLFIFSCSKVPRLQETPQDEAYPWACTTGSALQEAYPWACTTGSALQEAYPWACTTGSALQEAYPWACTTGSALQEAYPWACTTGSALQEAYPWACTTGSALQKPIFEHAPLAQHCRSLSLSMHHWLSTAMNWPPALLCHL